MSIAVVLTGVPRWMVEDDVLPPDMEEGVNEPHVTLYFFPELEDADLASLAEAAQDVAAFAPPKFRVAGYGKLGVDGATVLFLNATDDTTKAIRRRFYGAGVDLDGQFYPWIPHTTVGYDVPFDGLDSFIGAEFEAAAIEIWQGDERQIYKFAGA